VSADLLDALELLMFGAIGMTSVALAESAATDLTLAQWRALVVIGRSDGQRVGDVGSRIGMSLPSASRLIRRLERRGYVSIERDETDRRATLVRLTDDGRRTRAAVIARRRELMTSALAQRPGRLPKDLTLGLVSIAQALEFYE
jgi:DNA-binding MarR family transcriptional regulator